MKACFNKILSSQNQNPQFTAFALAALRIFAGLTMAFAHGLGKLPPSEQLIGGVSALGFPAPEFFAWSASLAEFAGGLLLALGLLTRPAAGLMAFTMMVAAFGAHAADPFSIKEMSLLYLSISLFFVFHGAGRWSADRLIFKK